MKSVRGCSWLKPQKTTGKEVNAYFTLAVLFEGGKRSVSWYDFRKKFMEFGGDGIYAAWALAYREPAAPLVSERGRFFLDVPAQGVHLKGFLRDPKCPVAEHLQPRMLQFTTNQNTAAERRAQALALKKTIAYFEKRAV